jgi:hypothetical protein
MGFIGRGMAEEGVDDGVEGDNLGDADPASVLAMVRPTLRYEFLGDAGSDR